MPGAASVPYGNVGLFEVMSLTLTPALIAGNTSAEQTFTLPGVKVGDMIFVQKPTTQAGLLVESRVVAVKDTVAVVFGNLTGSNITPTAAELYTFLVVRYENYMLQNPPTSLG